MYISKSIRRTTLLLAMMTLALWAPTAFAQDTLLISYQGRLTDDGGDPVTGTPAMIQPVFLLYVFELMKAFFDLKNLIL